MNEVNLPKKTNPGTTRNINREIMQFLRTTTKTEDKMDARAKTSTNHAVVQPKRFADGGGTSNKAADHHNTRVGHTQSTVSGTRRDKIGW